MLFKIALVIAVLYVIAHAGAWLYNRFFAGRTHSGYGDFAKDPNRARNARRAIHGHFKDQQRLTRLPPEQLVELLRTSDSPAQYGHALKNIGDDALLAVTAALQRPEFREHYSEAVINKMHAMERAHKPVQYLLECLEETPRPDLVPLIVPLLDDDDKWTRRHAAWFLGTTASDGCIEPLRKAINDEDFVRSAALQTVAESAKERRLSARFVAEMYDIILPHAVDKHGQTSNVPPAAALFALNPTRTATDLLSPQVLSAENKGVRAALKALRDHSVPVPLETLLRLLQQAESAPDAYPNEYIIEEILNTLVQSWPDAAKSAIQRNLTSSSKDVREYATKALCTASGLKDPWSVAFAQIDERGIDNVPAPVRHAALCFDLAAQVRNGGFSQYFVNGYGREWRRTLEALNAVNAPHSFAILKNAVGKFGPSGPDLKRYDRTVAELHQRVEDAWNAEDRAFYDDKDNLDALLLNYILANAQHFK